MQKCLIVDDADVIRKVAQAILSDMDYSVLEAENTDDALKACHTEQPNVVIIDWHIPSCDSLEFIETLRSTFTGRRPYVVYCTTEKDPEVISKAVEAGADDFLLKPFDRATLVTKFSEIKRAA